NAPDGIGSKFHESFTGDLIIANHGRNANISAFSYALNQWNLSEERKVIFFSQFFTTLFSENIIFVSGKFCRGKIAHVFHQPDYRNINLRLAKHGNTFFSICKCYFLRSSHHNYACHRYKLHQCKMDISGSRRHVNDQVIEFSPVNISHKLPDGTTGHGASPHHRSFFIYTQANAHYFNSEPFHRYNNSLVGIRKFFHHRPFPPYAKHNGSTWAVNIGVHHPHTSSVSSQGKSKIGRNRTFSNP